MDDFTKFQVQAANNQLEQPFATAALKFDNGDHTFWEHFVVLKNLTGTYIGLHFMSCNTVVIDTTHGLIHFPHLRMYVKSTARGTSAKHQAVFIHETMTIPRKTAKTITAFVDPSSKRNTTGTVTPMEKYTEAASLLLSHSTSRKFARNIAVSHHHNGITLFNQAKDTEFLIRRSHFGAIHDHQAGGHGNSQ